MSRLNAVVLDLETTGLNPRTDRITEIGMARIRDGRVTEQFACFVDPGRRLEQKIIDITGITDEMLQGAGSFRDVADELLLFLGDDVLLGHSIISDYAFLKKAVLSVLPKGSSFEKQGIDTLKIARRFLPGEQKKTLSQLCRYYGIELMPHRALADAVATYELYERLQEEFGQQAPEVFAPKPLLYQVKRETPIMPKQIEQIERLLKAYEITADREIEKMTKNEASRYVDRLRAQYSVLKLPEHP